MTATDIGSIQRVVGIVGSLRAGSFNRALPRAAIELQPAGMAISEAPIRDVPLFNQDVEDGGDPPAVTALRIAIAAADGVVIFCPEYNAGIPGVLKNAIDWASRSHEVQHAHARSRWSTTMAIWPTSGRATRSERI